MALDTKMCSRLLVSLPGLPMQSWEVDTLQSHPGLPQGCLGTPICISNFFLPHRNNFSEERFRVGSVSKGTIHRGGAALMTRGSLHERPQTRATRVSSLQSPFLVTSCCWLDPGPRMFYNLTKTITRWGPSPQAQAPTGDISHRPWR